MRIESPAPAVAGSREQFVAQFLAIAGDTRLLWMPEGDEDTTSVDRTQYQRTATYKSSVADQLSALGLGHAVTFDGAALFASVPDADELSFGDGSADDPFSVIALAKVTDTAASRVFASKYNHIGSAVREWEFRLTGGDALFFGLYDESADVAPFRLSSGAITQGAWALFGGTYDGGGGATAGDGMRLYQDGVAIASSATNQAAYVAMENTAAPVNIGSHGSSTTGGNFFPGDMALVAVVGRELSASEMWAIYQLCAGHFDFLA